MPEGELTDEVQFIDPKQYRIYNDLPLVTKGCDSYAAVYPQFKNLSPDYDVDTLASKIKDLLPDNQWRDEHLVITGGEPLLGWQKAYKDLLSHDLMWDLKEITFETNGTQELRKDLKEYLSKWRKHPNREVTFSVSAKLSCSGESREDAIKPEVVVGYQEAGYTYLKFVVATEKDTNEAIEVTQLYRAAGFTGPVYLMPIGGVEDIYSLNNKRVADLALQHGFRYSDRLQVPLYKNAWST